jgi:hypothetical protein
LPQKVLLPPRHEEGTVIGIADDTRDVPTSPHTLELSPIVVGVADD